MANWDARHLSSSFQLTWEHQKTFLRNWLSFWRRETIGVPVSEGVDEVASPYGRRLFAHSLGRGNHRLEPAATVFAAAMTS